MEGGQAAIEPKEQLADARQMLLEIATAARSFLVPHWERWHVAWGPPAPSRPSQWTCVRSSLLLVRALNNRGVHAAFRSGQPVDGQRCGLLTAHGWAGHAWAEADGFIIDITADQFGHAPVIVTPIYDPAYRQAEDQAYQLSPTRAGIAAVEEIWPAWCHYEGQQVS